MERDGIEESEKAKKVGGIDGIQKSRGEDLQWVWQLSTETIKHEVHVYVRVCACVFLCTVHQVTTQSTWLEEPHTGKG